MTSAERTRIDSLTAGLDRRRMGQYRLSRVQAVLQARGIDAAVLYDPINVRYATGSRNMLVWCLHNPVRYCFVPAAGRPVLFEFRNCEHVNADLPDPPELRPALGWSYFIAGEAADQRAAAWAGDLVALLKERMGPGARRLAFDRLDPMGLEAIRRNGIEVLDAQAVIERARSIKNADEITCIRAAIAVSEIGQSRLQAALQPGITENALWSIFHATNIEFGGEYIETRLLNSGQRTNPWFQECSDKVIADGDVICHDTDMVGPHGYCVDVSRTFFCGERAAPEGLRELYRLATEQVAYNAALIVPGLPFEDFMRRAWPVPNRFYAYHYATTVHGIGMHYEWPRVVYPEDWAAAPAHGCFAENMTVCIESYVGEEGGAWGVKFTEQALVTDRGVEILSRFPQEAALVDAQSASQ